MGSTRKQIEVEGLKATAGGIVGFADRRTALRHLFSELFPEAVLSRNSKARFNRIFFDEHSREFAGEWTGEGVDPELVDLDELARAWRAPEVSALTFALFQSCWMTRRARRAAVSRQRGRDA